MKPFVLTPYAFGAVLKEEVALLDRIREAMTALPDLDLGRDDGGDPYFVSCHMVARAVATVYGLQFRDGRFNGDVEHSWCVTANDNIVDAYPVGILGGPLLVVGPTWSRLYVEQPPQLLKLAHIDTQRFGNAVIRVTEALRSVARA